LSSREFELALPEGSLTDMLEDAKRRAREAGITLHGDESGGTFEGTATGRYAVEGRTIRVHVDRKPAFVPWALIEKGFQRAFDRA
jgi:hypothetical protein